ncbi:MAG: FxsA family protein [Mesorhizobium sp.]
MTRTLITLFVLFLPLLEIAGFVVVGSEIGALATVALVIAAGVLGAILVRVQGFGALRRAQMAAETGGQPDREIVHGALILVAGILLMIPGFITDILGLLLFIPPVRDIAWKALRNRISIITPRGRAPGAARQTQARVIELDETDYKHVDPSSPWRRDTPKD